MTTDSNKLRDREARPTRERLARDRDGAPEPLKPILDAFLDRLFDPNLQLQALWKELRIHDHNISTQFFQAFGKTPWAYLVDCRLEVAGRLLETTRVKLFQVSLAVGYGSYNNFSRAFKAWSGGRRPIDYRLRRLKRPFGPPPAEEFLCIWQSPQIV